jgi:hypothetical protein
MKRRGTNVTSGRAILPIRGIIMFYEKEAL